jgi:diguanylate cyclase (GGDEF)-like protein/PAS domain S-box-containing protein
MELRIRCKNGIVKTVLHHGVILPDAGWALATFIDITDRKRDELFLREAARQARESQAIYRTLLDHSPEMIVLSAFDKSRRYVSPAVAQVTGFTPEEYLALEPAKRFHPEDLSASDAVLASLRAGAGQLCIRHRIAHKDGDFRWVESTATAYLDPATRKAAGYVATVRDISAQIENENARASEHRQLAEAATRDELTGIANRRVFNLALAHETARLTRSTGELSLLLIDIDHFKLYNDHYGHLEGDACLRRVAQTIEGAVERANDLTARFGGEEFVVLAPSTDSRGAGVLARRILDAVAKLGLPHPASRHSIVTVSIGGTSAPAAACIDQAKLVDRADRALYIAKAEGRNTFRYLPVEFSEVPAEALS